MFHIKQEPAYGVGISDRSSDVCASDLYEEMRPGQRHHALAVDAERKRDPRMRGDVPEPELRHLRGDALLVAFRQVAGDDRPENGVEARLQLLRKRGDLLGDILDADHGGRKEQAEDREIKAERAPFDRIRARQRPILSGKREKLHRLWPPSPGPALAPATRHQA